MIRQVLRMILMAVFGVVDLVLFHIDRPVGFVGRALRDGYLAGFYSAEHELMEQLQAEQLDSCECGDETCTKDNSDE